MSNSALLVIDFINDIVHPNGKISGCAKMVSENKTIAKANKVIQHAEKKNWLIIFVKVAFSENYCELPMDSKFFNKIKELGALKLNSWGSEYINELNIPKNSISLTKNRVNVFYTTNLDLLLRTNHIVDLYLCGVSTEMAIQATARDACDRDYRVHIISDACANSSPEGHKSSLDTLQSLANVISVDSLVK